MKENTNNYELEQVKRQLLNCFDYLFNFNGFGHLEVDIKILKRGQKEILIRCGREYRFVVDSAENINRTIKNGG